jgi:hypothetical protein
MLAAWVGGGGHALDRLMEIPYPELRRVARQYLAGRGTVTMSARVSRTASGPDRLGPQTLDSGVITTVVRRERLRSKEMPVGSTVNRTRL